MLDIVALRTQAAEAFVAQLRDKAVWLAERCWASNLEAYIQEINEIIEAGRKMKVTEARQFLVDEIAEMVTDLSPLRTLKMKKEAREYIVVALLKNGVDPKVFDPKVDTK
ncbi:MAG: hypothetical protein AAB627_01990 [Patescibacteria group bacterium]